MRPIGILLSAALASLAMAAPLSTQIRALNGVTYTNSENTSYERFVFDDRRGVLLWQGGRIQPKHKLFGRKELVFLEAGMVELKDCSDSGFRCLFGAYRVFAVPQLGLSKNSEYSFGGARFRVEACLSGSDEHCSSALVSSACDGLAAPDKCVELPAKSIPSVEVGRTGYFIYEEGKGITSYGLAKGRIDLQEQKLATARQLLLRSKTGLLFQARED